MFTPDVVFVGSSYAMTPKWWSNRIMNIVVASIDVSWMVSWKINVVFVHI